MKIIVGLGNPGPEYERTRHNAGWLALDRLVRRHALGGGAGATVRQRFQSAAIDASVKGEKCLFLKPLNYMNRSGGAVAEAVNFFKASPVDDLFILVDEAALPTGTIRIRPEGSAGGHNGLADIERALGTAAYTRCRIGIDPPPPPMILHDYVLGRFTPEQEKALAPALDRAADAAEVFITSGVTAAMNKFNTKPPPPPSSAQAPPPRPPPPPAA